MLLDHVVTDLLDATGIPSAAIVASSAGSAFAFKAARRAPDRIRSVVHVGAPWLVEGIAVPGGEKAMLLPGVRHLIAALKPGRRMQASMHKSIGHAASVDEGRIPGAYWAWFDALIRETRTFGDQIRMLASFKGRRLDYAPALKVNDDDLSRQPRTLVIWGANETLATADDARALVDRIPGAALEVMAGAGHLPWLDDAVRVASLVRGFVQETRVTA